MPRGEADSQARSGVYQVSTGVYENGDRWIFYSDGTTRTIIYRPGRDGRMRSISIISAPRSREKVQRFKKPLF